MIQSPHSLHTRYLKECVRVAAPSEHRLIVTQYYDVLVNTLTLSNHLVSKAADNGSKKLISLAPDAWVQWVTQRPNVVAKEILGSEFQWISRAPPERSPL